jgi:hypothetical protein
MCLCIVTLQVDDCGRLRPPAIEVSQAEMLFDKYSPFTHPVCSVGIHWLCRLKRLLWYLGNTMERRSSVKMVERREMSFEQMEEA